MAVLQGINTEKRENIRLRCIVNKVRRKEKKVGLIKELQISSSCDIGQARRQGAPEERRKEERERGEKT